MFSGLVETVGVVTTLARHPGGLRLGITSDLPMSEIATGDSIAVDGVCLTVTSLTAMGASGGEFFADVAEETLRRSTLGGLQEGGRVHLERALQLSARLGGHIVQGHVDATATLGERRPDGEALWLTFAVGREWTRYMVEKGSICLDGVSLTLTAVSPGAFSVMLVPFTQQKTHLASKAVGDAVNVEVDVLAKYVERLMSARGEEGGQ